MGFDLPGLTTIKYLLFKLDLKPKWTTKARAYLDFSNSKSMYCALSELEKQ